jgi:hypothetical protein
MTMEMLVFKDGYGHYYVLSRDAWEQAQVPDARRHEVDKLLSARTSGPTARKAGDLSTLAPALRGGAIETKIMGSFRVDSPIFGNPASHNWSAPRTAP